MEDPVRLVILLLLIPILPAPFIIYDHRLQLRERIWRRKLLQDLESGDNESGTVETSVEQSVSTPQNLVSRDERETVKANGEPSIPTQQDIVPRNDELTTVERSVEQPAPTQQDIVSKNDESRTVEMTQMSVEQSVSTQQNLVSRDESRTVSPSGKPRPVGTGKNSPPALESGWNLKTSGLTRRKQDVVRPPPPVRFRDP